MVTYALGVSEKHADLAGAGTSVAPACLPRSAARSRSWSNTLVEFTSNLLPARCCLSGPRPPRKRLLLKSQNPRHRQPPRRLTLPSERVAYSPVLPNPAGFEKLSPVCELII